MAATLMKTVIEIQRNISSCLGLPCPGITGLAQVKARHRASFEKMLQYDLEYIRGQSLLLDLKLMLWTIPALLKGV